MDIFFNVEIPKVEVNVDNNKTISSLSVNNNETFFYNVFLSKDGIEIEIPSTTYVWILSSQSAQPIGTRGIWVDESTWVDDNIFYT